MWGAGLGILVGLIVVGIPIWIALTIGAVFFISIVMAMPVLTVPMTMFGSVDSFVLLAVPFFLLAGNIMAYCGPARHIYDAVDSCVGHLKGGLAFTTVLTCMVYAAITGSTTATLAGVSAIAAPPMERAGYSKAFIAGLLSVSSTLGQMIPPSILMILYGALAQQNAGVLFISGIVPGVLIGLALGFVAIWLSRGQNVQLQPRRGGGARARALARALPALLMPVIVLGGIYGGIFTPTEAAAISCAYAVFISAFVYRQLGRYNFFDQALRGAVANSSMVLLLVAAAMLLATPLAFARLPQEVAAWAIAADLSAFELVLATTALWLVLGMFLDPLPVMYLTLPVLLPALNAAGVDLVYMNVVLILAMQIAQITPPFGISLYVTSGILGLPITAVVRESLPFLAVLLGCLLLLLAFPQISLFLPRLMAG